MVAGTGLDAEASYYANWQNSDSIMDVTHLPVDIFDLLQAESAFLGKVAYAEQFTAVVELGCHVGWGLLAAKILSLQYVGVDINRRAIGVLNKRISAECLTEGSVGLCGDLRSADTWSRIESRVDLNNGALAYLPFNFIGTTRDPVRILRHLATKGCSAAVISAFNTTPMAIRVREQYYKNCGVRNVRFHRNRYGGTTFIGDGDFWSHSFSEEGLVNIVHEAGLLVEDIRTTELGIMLLVSVDITRLPPSTMFSSTQVP